MNKIIELYLNINYSGQRILNKHNSKKGLIYMMGVQITFVLSGFIIWIMVQVFGRINPMVGACSLGLFVFVFRNVFDRKIYRKINFDRLNVFYNEQSLYGRISYTVLSILLLLLCIFMIGFIPKTLSHLF